MVCPDLKGSNQVAPGVSTWWKLLQARKLTPKRWLFLLEHHKSWPKHLSESEWAEIRKLAKEKGYVPYNFKSARKTAWFWR